MGSGEGGDGGLRGSRQSERAAELMDLLGLSEGELCQVLDVDALTLLSGQLEHRTELPILLDLLTEARERAGVAVLRRDFGAFEDAVVVLAERGFVLRGRG